MAGKQKSSKAEAKAKPDSTDLTIPWSDISSPEFPVEDSTTQSFQASQSSVATLITSKAHEVLFNQDLLDIILEHCPTEDIANARLINSIFDKTASPHLFRTIVWDTAPYDHRNEPSLNLKDTQYLETLQMTRFVGFTMAGGLEDDDIENDSYEAPKMVHRMHRMQVDDGISVQDLGNLHRLLSGACVTFTGLTRAVITSWYRGQTGTEQRLSENVFLGNNETMPGPINSLFSAILAHHRQNIIFESVVAALCLAKRSLRELVIQPSKKEYIHEPAWLVGMSAFPTMLIDFSRCHPRLYQCLTNLTSLHLDLADEEHPGAGAMQVQNCLKDGALARWVTQNTSLQKLHVRLYSSRVTRTGTIETARIPPEFVTNSSTYQQLRELSLDSFWLSPGELCSMLRQHSATLAKLTLANVNLGGFDPPTNPRLQKIEIVELPRPEARPVLVKQAYQKLPWKWRMLALTCQDLPLLQGLKIDVPSSGLMWETLSVYQAEEVERVGMKGRRNDLCSHEAVEYGSCLSRSGSKRAF